MSNEKLLDPNTKRFMKFQLMWLGISIAIAIALSFLLPFPYDIIAIVGVFLSINYFIRQRQMRKMGMSAWSPFGGAGRSGQSNVSYYCMNCGTKHNQARCPNCGSNLKKAGF